LTTHQILRKSASVFRWKGASARAAKGLELFKLRSEVYLLAHRRPTTNFQRTSSRMTRRHYGKNRSFHHCDGLITSLFLLYDEQSVLLPNESNLLWSAYTYQNPIRGSEFLSLLTRSIVCLPSLTRVHSRSSRAI
jgi:hypothetical protein